MKRNCKGAYEYSRLGNERHTSNDGDLKTILCHVSEMRSEIKQFTFHQKMDRVDVSKYFPLEDDEMLEEFMDRNNDGWDQRRRGFNHLLYNTVSRNKKRFSCALLHLLFTREFIRDHKWPMAGG